MPGSRRFDLDPDTFLLQHFVSEFGVFEVYWVRNLLRLVCTCPGYRVRRRCKHLQHLAHQLSPNGFELQFDCMPSPMDLRLIENDVEYARYWTLYHTPVAVL